jgi:RecA-family ATPase
VAGDDDELVDIRVWDAADVLSQPIPPRQWILGNIFCKQFISSLVGGGAVGKTAARLVQALSVATGRSLTGEYVHKRCRLLFLTFEDGRTELMRRVLAAMLHHSVSALEVHDWLLFANVSQRPSTDRNEWPGE